MDSTGVGTFLDLSWTKHPCQNHLFHREVNFLFNVKPGLVRDLNPGPLAPKARIIRLDQRASMPFGGGAQTECSTPDIIPQDIMGNKGSRFLVVLQNTFMFFINSSPFKQGQNCLCGQRFHMKRLCDNFGSCSRLPATMCNQKSGCFCHHYL